MVTLLSLYWPWEELEANGYYHYIDILLLNDALELDGFEESTMSRDGRKSRFNVARIVILTLLLISDFSNHHQ